LADIYVSHQSAGAGVGVGMGRPASGKSMGIPDGI
jgi:hypothetical protein